VESGKEIAKLHLGRCVLRRQEYLQGDDFVVVLHLCVLLR